jgi:hypothetical protein
MQRFLILTTLLGCIAGCNASGMTTVAGKVTLDGQPIAKGTISLTPEDGLGPTAEASIIDGSFTTQAAPGPKKVQIFGYKKVGEYRITPESPLIDKLEQIVPPQFNEQSSLKCEVSSDLKPLEFDLKSDA